MTTINEPPNHEPEKPNPLKRLVNKLKSSPKKTASGIVAIAALGSLAYWGVDFLVKKKLPPFLEAQASKFIERPVDLGEVKGFSWSGIEFGKTVIPPTANDTDKITVDGIKVGFNLLPVLFRRTLPLDITLIQPDIYLEQEQDGEWLNLAFLEPDPNKERKDPLLYFDVNLDVQEADITAVPYQQDPLQAQLDGTGRFNQKQNLLNYDLDAGIEEANAQLEGKAELETGTIDTKLLVKDLALTDVTTLLPNLPVSLDSGELNADLDVNIPSWSEITAANIQGQVNLQNLSGEATAIDAPVSAESELDFNGRDAQIKAAQASLGDITAQIDGRVNLDTGYDVDAEVLPFQLASLPPGIQKQIPVDLAGEVAAQVKLQGAIKEPKLTGQINSTQPITVAETQFRQINANFRADLAKIVLENVQIAPTAGGKITAEGTIQTNIQAASQRDRQIDPQNMPVAFSFTADLPTAELIAPYYQLPPQVTVGSLDAQGQVNGTLGNPEVMVQWDLAEVNTAQTEDIAGSGKIVFSDRNLVLEDTQVTYGDGKADLTANANLDSKQWQANLNADSLNLTPFLSQVKNPNLNLNRPVALNAADVSLNGRLDQLSPEQVTGTANLDLNVDGGDVAVNSQLSNGNLQAQATTQNIPIDNFVTNLPVATKLDSGTVKASGQLNKILAIAQNPNNLNNFNSLTADADLNLRVDNSPVTVDSTVENGIVTANVNTSQIDLNRVVPNLPVPANLESSQVTASAQLQQLLTFNQNPNLSTVDARVNADLRVAEGTVKAIANLDNNQWQATANANNISSKLLLEKFAPQNLASIQTDNIDAQLDLSGDINPVINNEVNIPVNVNQLIVNSGVQRVNAQGDFTLSNITSNLDVASTNLDLAANLDFDRLPIDSILAATTQNNQLIADSVNIQGKTQFNGQLQGKQLISAPTAPGNLNLTGELQLQDFAFNDIVFEPQMAGDITVEPGSEIALNLQGESDTIAARVVPCEGANCKLPYLPTDLEIRQGEDTEQPVIATGDRQGDRFNLDIQNFPLALLNLAPAKTAGIEGALQGTTTGNLNLDLYTLAAQGNIAIADPGLGYIQADKLNANFNYDPANNLAELTSSALDFGRSQYNLNAALNLESGQIDGKLDIPQGYVQDILNTLRWFTIEDVTNLFNIPDYAEAAAIKPAPERDTVDESIARKLNKLRQINRQIQANAAAKENMTIPSKLDLQGRYEGEVIIGGTIQTPKADFLVAGNDWQWQPTDPYPDIVPPLGLVIEESQFISLPKLLIDGNLRGTEVDLAKAELQVEEAVLSLRGKLTPNSFDTKYAVANLTVDNITNFVEIPVDLAGEINTVGTFKGTVEQPQITGKIAFTEGAYNGNVLPTKIAGDYNYDGTKLAFATTAPDAIQVEASVPYPIIPGQSDRFTAKADLDTEAFVLLEAFSQNYLSWVGGKGDAQLEANARLDLERAGVIYDLDAQGVVNLEDAQVNLTTPFFEEQFEGTGKITLDNQVLNVETLNGTFAEKDLTATGKFPILRPVNNLDNPLTIDIPEGKIKIDKLYDGDIAGQVNVTGAALEPIIAGQVNLEDGKVSIPKTEKAELEGTELTSQIPQLSAVSSSQQQPTKTKQTKPQQKAQGEAQTQSAVVTTLKDLQINLEKLKLEQTPIYAFQVDGGLTLNGTVDQPSNIRPEGTLTVTKADVNLFSNSFELAKNLENNIVFTPDAGVLNPTLNVVLRTEVAQGQGDDDSSRDEAISELRSVDSNSNEIKDPISSGVDLETIRISLVVDGEAEEILPNLAQTDTNCVIRPVDSPLVENKKYYTQAELDRLTECFNGIALTTDDNNSLDLNAQRSIINSSAVQLTSTPALDQGDIIDLLSQRFLAFAQQTISGGSGEGLSQERLFDIGVNRFVIDPLVDSALYRVENTTVGWGKKVGFDYFTVYPDVEATYEINQKSSLRVIYDYNLLANISDSAGLGIFDDEGTSGNEVRVQYQLNFK